MFKIIHPNRWLIWTVALIVMIFIVVWGAIERYAIEQETEITGQNSLLGRETSKLDTTGWKTYRNEQYGFEFKYPPELVVDRHERAQSYTFFSISRPSKFGERGVFCTHGIGCYVPDLVTFTAYVAKLNLSASFKDYVTQNLVRDEQVPLEQLTSIRNHEAYTFSRGMDVQDLTSIAILLNENTILRLDAAYASELDLDGHTYKEAKEARNYALTAQLNIFSTLTFFEPKR